MKKKAVELQELMVKANQYRNDLEAKHAEGEDITGDERQKLANMIEAGKALRIEVEQEAELDNLNDFVSKPAHDRRSKMGQPVVIPVTWGETVLDSKQFKIAAEAMSHEMERVMVKDLHGVTAAAGGALVQDMREAGIVGLPEQPRSILDLITVSQTGSNSVEFARQTSRTSNAAPVLDYDTSGGDFYQKPKSDIAFELVTVPVRTIPTYVVAGRNILSDAPQLKGLIDNELTYMVRVELEDQCLNGDGAGANLEGILQTSGIQTRTQADTSDRGGEATDTKADAIRRAITDIQLAFYEVDGALLNPGDGEDLELLKDANGNYVNVFDPIAMRIWRVPVVESPIIDAGTALVGNFRMGATLWDRQQTEIRVGEPGNFFLQNAVAVLAELRAAFGVKRTQAFEKVTFS